MEPIVPAQRRLQRLRVIVSLRFVALGLFCSLDLVAGGSLITAAEPGSPRTRTVDFNREVRPILAKNCFACHGQDEAKRAKGLRLDRREAAVKPLKSGETAIVPGDPDSSALIVRVTEEDETLRMPPRKHGNRLTPAEIDVLKRWIGRAPSIRRTGR